MRKGGLKVQEQAELHCMSPGIPAQAEGLGELEEQVGDVGDGDIIVCIRIVHGPRLAEELQVGGGHEIGVDVTSKSVLPYCNCLALARRLWDN